MGTSSVSTQKCIGATGCQSAGGSAVTPSRHPIVERLSSLNGFVRQGRGGRSASVFPWVFIALAWPSIGAADSVRIVTSGPSVPYESVIYSAERKRGTIVATVSKRFVEPFGGQDEISLLTEDAWARLRAQLEAADVFSLPSIKRPKARVTVVVEVKWGGREARWTIDNPQPLFDKQHTECIEHIRALVTQRVGQIAFRDAMLLPAESGRLRIFADRPASVAIDGVSLGLETPLLGVRVGAGTHEVSLTPLRGGPVYSYSVKVEAGKTTSLAVELK